MVKRLLQASVSYDSKQFITISLLKEHHRNWQTGHLMQEGEILYMSN